MLELTGRLVEWRRQRRRFAVATVVSVPGSAPRPVGAALAVDSSGEVVGTVSGGCAEGAVHDLCLEALATGEHGVHRFGWSGESAFAVDLTCGERSRCSCTPNRRCRLPRTGCSSRGSSPDRRAGGAPR